MAAGGEVEKAIDRGRRLHFRYSRYPEKRADEITCDPLGLLFRPPVLYLIARNAKGELRQYALHRMERAELLADRTTTSGFDFDDFIRQGEPDMTWGGEPVRVVVAVTKTFAKIWHGTPLGCRSRNGLLAAGRRTLALVRSSAVVPQASPTT